MSVEIFPLDERFRNYLFDESQYTGTAESISFPENEAELQEVFARLGGIPVTVQGGKTGVAGGAVPEGGHILNCSRMNRIKAAAEPGRITAEPGATLLDLRKAAGVLPSGEALFFPPEPTELTATIGGVAAVGAQGIWAARYGTAKQYITEARILGADGAVRTLTGAALAETIGGEGRAGVFTELTLRLLPKPESLWGIMIFFAHEPGLCGFADALDDPSAGFGEVIAAAEYLDTAAIRLIESYKPHLTAIQSLPPAETACAGAVYLELHGPEAAIEAALLPIMRSAERYGGNGEGAWAVSGEGDAEKLRAFRHAAAETANRRVAVLRQTEPRLTKLGTDMGCRHTSFTETLRRYREGIRDAGISASIFGHIRDRRLQVNFFPKDYAEYQRGIGLIRQWAAAIAAEGGTIVGEHGVGKLKKRILAGLIPD